jgi:hypothetical protein
MTETWYVLYGGTSVDGMGPGIYVGRTTDEKVALEHYHKCRKDPLHWICAGLYGRQSIQNVYFRMI